MSDLQSLLERLKGAKLTTAQHAEMDICNRIGGGYYPGPKSVSAVRACVRKGLMTKAAQYGPYNLTDTGRSLLQALIASKSPSEPSA